MKAAFYEQKGRARDVFRIGDIPIPAPGPGEVLVRVALSAVNPSDTKNRGGWGPYSQMPFPRIIPHNDGAGIVADVGAGVAKTRIGEQVWIYEAQRNGRAFGTAAEYVALPSINAIKLPDTASFALGASLGVPAMTAHRCLFIDGGIQGQTVLVQGGAGAVGHMAVQLARWAGARVIATISQPERERDVRDAGAHVVLYRKTENISERVHALTAGEGVDRIVEVAFEDNQELDRQLLRANGVISTFASGAADSAPAIPFHALMLRGITIHFVLVYVMPVEAHAAAIRDITAAIEVDALRAGIGPRFPLERIAEAHEAQDAGGSPGKILIEVDPALC